MPIDWKWLMPEEPRGFARWIVLPLLWLQAGIYAIIMYGLAIAFFVGAAVGIIWFALHYLIGI